MHSFDRFDALPWYYDYTDPRTPQWSSAEAPQPPQQCQYVSSCESAAEGLKGRRIRTSRLDAFEEHLEQQIKSAASGCRNCPIDRIIQSGLQLPSKPDGE